jgi:hypothetical protein
MGYDVSFYETYAKYLSETNVREAHDWVFQIVMRNDLFQSVIDLGCGQFNEFKCYAKPSSYLGIDTHAILPNVKADYRSVNLMTLLKESHLGLKDPSAFVSLFSTEITSHYGENYRLYDRIFTELPVKMGLVSGFFYAENGSETIEETGGIHSFQTLEKIESVQSSLFSEKRIILPVPSEMFGESVFEVWKIFEKRSR